MDGVSYSEAMERTDAYFTVTLDLSNPIEISDFAAFFAGVGSQFDDYLSENHPDLKGTAKLYVREVRRGSVVADMIPLIQETIGLMDAAVIVLAFGGIFNNRIRTWVSGQFVPDASKKNIQHMTETIRAVAHDKGGELRLESITYEDGILKKRLEAKFDTKEARKAFETMESQKRSLDTPTNVDYSRVLMRFTRTDIGDAKVGKRSGELVVVDEIQTAPLALMYGSELAEERLKDEIRDHESVYYKGFVVDVNVQKSAAGRNLAYSVTNVHQVIELPDDLDSDVGGTD